MKRHYTLIPADDACTGEVGWILEKLQAAGLNETGDEPATSYRGSTIAHDLLEHASLSAIGSATDEIRALGSSMYVRGEQDGYRNGLGMWTDPIDTLRGDVANALRYAYWHGETLRMPARAPTPDAWAEELARKGIRDAWAELRDDAVRTPDGKAYTAQLLREWRRTVPRLLQAGYARARRRWPSGYQAAALFREIADACDSAMGYNATSAGFGRPRAEPERYERIRLTVDYAALTARAVRYEDFGPEEY